MSVISTCFRFYNSDILLSNVHELMPIISVPIGFTNMKTNCNNEGIYSPLKFWALVAFSSPADFVKIFILYTNSISKNKFRLFYYRPVFGNGNLFIRSNCGPKTLNIFSFIRKILTLTSLRLVRKFHIFSSALRLPEIWRPRSKI